MEESARTRNRRRMVMGACLGVVVGIVLVSGALAVTPDKGDYLVGVTVTGQPSATTTRMVVHVTGNKTRKVKVESFSGHTCDGQLASFAVNDSSKVENSKFELKSSETGEEGETVDNVIKGKFTSKKTMKGTIKTTFGDIPGQAGTACEVNYSFTNSGGGSGPPGRP